MVGCHLDQPPGPYRSLIARGSLPSSLPLGESLPMRTKTLFGYSWSSGVFKNMLIPLLHLINVLEFFAHKLGKGKEYCSLNLNRSALSSVLPPLDDSSVDKHLMVVRVLRGAFHLPHSNLKYTKFWLIDLVLWHIKGWGSSLS